MKPLPDETLSSTGESVSAEGPVKTGSDRQVKASAAFHDTKVKLQGLLAQVSADGLTPSLRHEITVTLNNTQQTLKSNGLMFGVLFCADLVTLIEVSSDHRASNAATETNSVVEDSLEQLMRYLGATGSTGHDAPVLLLWPLNDLRASLNQPLITERVLALSPDYSAAKIDSLVSVVPALEADFNAQQFYAAFTEMLASLYRGQSGSDAGGVGDPGENTEENSAGDPLQLAQLLRGSINQGSHEYAAIFWFTCSVFVSCIESRNNELMPAVKYVLRQIDLVIKHFVVDTDTPVLSAEGIESVEHVMCNMLCFIATRNPDDPIVAKLEQQFEARKSLQQIGTTPVAVDGILLVSTIQSTYRLIARSKLGIDAAARTDTVSAAKVIENLSCLLDACSLLVCAEATLHIESAIKYYRRFLAQSGVLSDRDACATELMHAERSMLQLFPMQLATVSHGSGSLSYKDKELLDELLIRELLVELKPIHIEDDSGEGLNPEVSAEWLQAVLLDMVSAVTFLSDSFLSEELAPLQSDLDGLLMQGSQPFLLQLAMSVNDYLSVYKVADQRVAEQEHVHVSLAQLVRSCQDIQQDAEPSLAELISENNSILATEPESAEMVVKAKSNVLSDATDLIGNSAAKITTAESQSASVDFGNDCNIQVDIIQHALDTALGSSGNLSPDRSVVAALENLHNSVKKAGLDSLLTLIEPLSQILISAENAGSTLSQSDTLLVQEAIVAITLGVDSLVNGKPMSALVDDVAQRMTAVAIDGRHHVRGEYESAGLVGVFVEEAEDLLQRLFELVQRWRGAPQGANKGGSRLQRDISRLLHTVKGSADTVGLNTIVTLAHHLESALVSLPAGHDPSDEFFDLALETIESLSEDIDRVRNSEQISDRRELIIQLQAISTDDDSSEKTSESKSFSTSGNYTGSRSLPGQDNTASHFLERSAERAPAFGSAKYFQALELSERQLKRNNSDVLELHDTLRSHVAEIRSTLQSTRYLLGNAATSASTDKSVEECLSDLESVQRNLRKLAGRIGAVDDKQTQVIQALGALVSAADRVSVDSIRLRMESIVQKSAELAGKKVNFRFLGSELELDRKLFSDLVSPLEQLLTNAVVHGIETTSRRSDNNKAGHGIVELLFKIEADTLLVTVSDDGAGINVEEVRRRLASYPELGDASSLSETEVLKNLVLQGVSTAPRADRTSGRGVGLDVVLQSVYSHRGTLSVTTTAGAGSEFTLSIALHTVPSQVVVVEVAGQYYALDCNDLLEVQGESGQGDTATVSLNSLLGVAEPLKNEDTAVLSCRSGQRLISLRVDSIVGRRTLNFNHHDAVLNSLSWCSGSAILDGRDVVLKVDTGQLHKLKPKTTDRSGASAGAAPQVLIVDDSVTIRASFGRAMTAAGYNIILARNGVEAIEILQSTQPAVIILDLEMPQMNGFDLAAYIRSEQRLDQSKIVVVTSRPKHQIEDWLLSVKARGYFEKPCAEAVLAEAVTGLLKRPE